MPVSKLKTPAGVDHDYNFLSGIERERERNQREVVEERGLFTQREVREMDNEKRWRKMWFGEEVHFVAAGDRSRGIHRIGIGSDVDDDSEADGRGERRGIGGGKMSNLARKLRARLEQTATRVVQMPMGMSRQRENATAWNRRTGGINWTTEWIIYDQISDADKEGEEANRIKQTPLRIRHKALESVPLYKAFGNSMIWHRRGQQGKVEDQEDNDDDDAEACYYARKKRRVLIKEVKEENRRTAMQDHDERTWFATTPYPTQNPYTCGWDTDRGAMVSSWLVNSEVEARRSHRFYLHKPIIPAGKPKELIPLESAETLSSALQGRTVLEYPTIYVLPPCTSQDTAPSLPEGYVLGSTERRAPPPRNPQSEKRKADDKIDGSAHKRQAFSLRGGRGSGRGRGRGGRALRQTQRQEVVDDAEEGEVADTSSSDPDTSSDDEASMDPDHNHHQERGIVGLNPAVDASCHVSKVIPFASHEPKKAGLGLVDYGSDSDHDSGEEGQVDEEDVDLSKLNPEKPELVAGAIQEIVGLLS